MTARTWKIIIDFPALQGTNTTSQHTPTCRITNKNDPQKNHRLETTNSHTYIHLKWLKAVSYIQSLVFYFQEIG